jgi:hypothetical protein
MAIDKVFWGARQSGKTTALLQWAADKRVVWYKPTVATLRFFKRKYPHIPASQNLEALKGVPAIVIDDAELVDPRILMFFLSSAYEHIAIGFTPPMYDRGNVQVLRSLTQHENAEFLENTHISIKDLKIIQQQCTTQMWKTQYEAKFPDEL